MKDVCITCCWSGLVEFAWHLAKLVAWPALIYGVVYVVGAVVFLANLRAKVGPSGKLVVEWDSWAYMLARPYRYGKINAAVERYGSVESAVRNNLDEDWFNTSICPLYARLLNMLLFVWPVLLVYFAAVSVLGTLLFGVVMGVGYARPDFTKDGWMARVVVRDYDLWPNGWTFLLRIPVVYYITAFALFMITMHFTMFLHGLWFTLLGVLCVLPVIAIVVALVFGSRKVMREKDGGATRVGLAAEFLASKKEGWCKMVEIK